MIKTDEHLYTMTRVEFARSIGKSREAVKQGMRRGQYKDDCIYNGKQLLGRRTVEVMLSPQYEITNTEKDLFSLGFSLTSKRSSFLGMRSEGSFTWGGYYGTTYWADPKEKMIVLIMTQQSPNSHSEITPKIENIIYGRLKK
jgi:CubicO group peptidase (beta-lactamase class C family)